MIAISADKGYKTTRKPNHSPTVLNNIIFKSSVCPYILEGWIVNLRNCYIGQKLTEKEDLAVFAWRDGSFQTIPTIQQRGWQNFFYIWGKCTGWSINNRTILNCSHFLARRHFFNPFSPKRSIHTGKLPQQQWFANASFVILFRCHFVSPYHVDGSANNVLCRGGLFCEIAWVLAHTILSQVQLEQENSLNSLKRYPKTSWPEGSIHFQRNEWFWSEARPAGRRPWQRMKKGEYWNCLSSRAPSPSRAPGVFEMTIERASFCSSRTCKNLMRVYSGDFSRNDGLATERYLLNRPIARWNNVTPNQNNKWCHEELMLLW